MNASASISPDHFAAVGKRVVSTSDSGDVGTVVAWLGDENPYGIVVVKWDGSEMSTLCAFHEIDPLDAEIPAERTIVPPPSDDDEETRFEAARAAYAKVVRAGVRSSPELHRDALRAAIDAWRDALPPELTLAEAFTQIDAACKHYGAMAESAGDYLLALVTLNRETRDPDEAVRWAYGLVEADSIKPVNPMTNAARMLGLTEEPGA